MGIIDKPNPDLKKPFHVVHSNGDLIKGFEDQGSADNDAKDRNARAEILGVSCRYKMILKP